MGVATPDRFSPTAFLDVFFGCDRCNGTPLFTSQTALGHQSRYASPQFLLVVLLQQRLGPNSPLVFEAPTSWSF